MELNPFAYEFHENPYPTYRWFREHAPLYRIDALDFWALSRFRDVLDALGEWQTYSSAEGILLERLPPKMLEATPMMIFLDPPRHDRLRRLVSRVFTPRRVASLEPSIRETAVRLLDPLVAQGGGDFVTDFSTPLPMEVIFTLLGIPGADRPQVREWMDQALDRDPDTPKLPARAIEAMMHTMRYWLELLATLRSHPNDGLICGLFQAEIETDDGGTSRLTDGEIIGLCSLLGGAGTETTTRLLASAAVLLASHRAEYGRSSPIPPAFPVPSRRSSASARRRSTRPGPSPATSPGTGRRCRPVPASSCSSVPPTATSASFEIPIASTSAARSPSRWASGTAYTIASARRSHASRPASRWRSSRGASRVTPSTRHAADGCT